MTKDILFEYPEPPPNAKTKVVCEMVAAVKADKTSRVTRNEGRQDHLFVPSDNAEHVSDDEDEDYETDRITKAEHVSDDKDEDCEADRSIRQLRACQ